MNSVLLVLSGGQLVAAICFGSIAMYAVSQRRHALNQEIAQLNAEGNSKFAAYQRFAAARVRTLLGVQRTNIYIIFALFVLVFIGILFLPTYLSSIAANQDGSTYGFNVFPYIVPTMIALLVGIIVSAIIQDIVGASIDEQALHAFGLSETSRQDIVASRLKRYCYSLFPTIIYLEVLGALSLVGATSTILYLVMAFLLFAIVRQFLAAQFYRWSNYTVPIGQTTWAGLEPRIRQWGSLAGVDINEIRLCPDIQIGNINARLIGFNRPTFFISEILLNYTDWRQQDALAAMLLGLQRKHFLRNDLISTTLIYGVGILITGSILFPLAVYGPSFLFSPDFFLAPVFIFLLAAIGIRVARGALARSLRNMYFDSDRMAAFLTGDPVAIMVVQNTITAINGVPLALRGRRIPSSGERMQKLDELARQPWQRAPYAGFAVPAAIPATFGSYTLTTTLDNALPPAAVPEQPYVDIRAL